MHIPSFANTSIALATIAGTTIWPVTQLTESSVAATTRNAITLRTHVPVAQDDTASQEAVLAPRVESPGGIPGYDKMLIPLNAANKMQEVPHSAVAAAIEQFENGTYLEFNTSPADGPYFKSHKGTNVTTALQFAEEHQASIPFIFTNPSKAGICILGSATNNAPGQGATFMFAPNKTDTNNMLHVSPKSTVQVGNFLPSGLANFNGRMEVHFGCDKTCGKCGGPSRPINTLVEFALIKWSEESERGDEGFWSNLSNVDGLSSNVNITVFTKEDKVCHGRSISTTAKEVKKLCPPALFWKDSNGNVGCSSECKQTGSDAHCCVGAFNPQAGCPPSSTFLKKLTPDAYSYATDDVGQVNICKQPKAVHVEFTPIH